MLMRAVTLLGDVAVDVFRPKEASQELLGEHALVLRFLVHVACVCLNEFYIRRQVDRKTARSH